MDCKSIFKAIKNRHIDCLKHWIKMGAVNQKHHSHDIPLDYAVYENYSEAVLLILEAGGTSLSVSISGYAQIDRPEVYNVIQNFYYPDLTKTPEEYF